MALGVYANARTQREWFCVAVEYLGLNDMMFLSLWGYVWENQHLPMIRWGGCEKGTSFYRGGSFGEPPSSNF